MERKEREGRGKVEWGMEYEVPPPITKFLNAPLILLMQKAQNLFNVKLMKESNSTCGCFLLSVCLCVSLWLSLSLSLL